MKIDTARCLQCGHEFGMAENAAMTISDDETERCVIECAACGSPNEVRAEPQPGFDAQPTIVVLGLVDRPTGVDPVFEETVRSGVHPPATTCGESN